MINLTRKLFVTLIATMLSFSVNAYDFKEISGVDTIYYNKTSVPNIVFVTYKSLNEPVYAGEIDIPQYITVDGKKYIVGGIGENAFKNCTALTSVKLPVGIEYIEADAFRNCVTLTEIKLPEYLRKLGYYAFGNTSLKEIEIPAVKEIEGMAFKGCKSLQKVVMHDSIKVVGDYAFMDCINLKTANIPLAMERLGRSAFFNCVKLGEEVTISHKAKLIGLYAFGNCHNLKVIRCDGTAYIPYCEKGAFGDVYPINKKLIVPPGTKNAYKHLQEWKDFSSIVEE